MRFAKIENGIVTGIYIYKQEDVADDKSLVADTGDVHVGDTYSVSKGFARTALPHPTKGMNLSDAKQLMRDIVSDRAKQAEDSGITVDGKVMPTDPNSRTSYVMDTVAKNLIPNKMITKKAMNGEFVKINKDKVHIMADLISTHLSEVRENEMVLTGAIDAAVNLTVLRAIDIESGWPTMEVKL